MEAGLKKSREKESRVRLLMALLSLLSHLALFFFIQFKQVIKTVQTSQEFEEKRIRVILFNEDMLSKQIVTSEKSKDKSLDPLTRFLSRDTQSFKQQTISKNIGKFKEGGSGFTGAKLSPTSKKISFSDLSFSKNKASKTSVHTDSGTRGQSANNDFIVDIPVGNRTQLNTVEYIYYGFYHRIKQKLDQYWTYNVSNKIVNLWKRNQYSYQSNRMTTLVITLDQLGNLTKIKIKGSSGVEGIDQAAIDSFRRAEPFPNPPKGMVKNGEVQIEWAFVIL